MKALLCREYGPPQSLRLEDLPSPQAGEGQVVVSVRAAGVNFPDSLIIQGKYQYKPALPFAPGAELAGIVQSVGPGVTRFKPGDAVAAITTFGAFASEIAVALEDLLLLPPGIDFNHAAAFGMTYGTAFHALKDRAKLRAGETLLVLGAAGGVGLAAVELGKHMGARVIAAAAGKTRLAACQRYGADAVIDYSNMDSTAFRAALKLAMKQSMTPAARAAGSEEPPGPDVIFDPLGGTWTEAAFRSIAWRGRLLVVGFAAGEIPRLPLNLALLKGASVQGVFWGEFRRREARLHNANMKQLALWISQGELKPLVSATYPLARGADALDDLLARKIIGKAVLTL